MSLEWLVLLFVKKVVRFEFGCEKNSCKKLLNSIHKSQTLEHSCNTRAQFRYRSIKCVDHVHSSFIAAASADCGLAGFAAKILARMSSQPVMKASSAAHSAQHKRARQTGRRHCNGANHLGVICTQQWCMKIMSIVCCVCCGVCCNYRQAEQSVLLCACPAHMVSTTNKQQQ